jgi:hypothetical protein
MVVSLGSTHTGPNTSNTSRHTQGKTRGGRGGRRRSNGTEKVTATQAPLRAIHKEIQKHTHTMTNRGSDEKQRSRGIVPFRTLGALSLSFSLASRAARASSSRHRSTARLATHKFKNNNIIIIITIITIIITTTL